jgi:isopenicillin N synthase-like dioxygenase
MKNLNTIQKFYFDQIKSDKLKKLFASSYTFLTLEDTEKLDLLITAGAAQSDPQAEKELIEMFEQEQKDIQQAVDSAEPLTPETAIKQAEVMAEESAAYAENINKLNRMIREDKEVKENKTEVAKINALEALFDEN